MTFNKINNKTMSVFGIALLLSSIFIAGCKKKENTENPQNSASTALILNATQVEPFSYLSFSLPAGSSPKELSEGVIEVKIGSQNIQGSRINNEQTSTYTYQIFVPEINPGMHTISVTLSNDIKSEASVNILAATAMNDPNSYIEQFKNELQQEYDEISAVYDAMVNAGNLRKSAADSLKAIMQESMSEISTHSDGLNNEELKLYARMLKANIHWLTEYYSTFSQFPLTNGFSNAGTDPCQNYKDAYQTALSNNRSDEANQATLDHRQCQENSRLEKLQANSGYMAKLESAYEDAKLEYQNTPGFKKASTAFLKTFFTAAKEGIIDQFKANNNLSDVKFGIESIEDGSKRNKVIFLNNEATSFSAGIILTNLNRQSNIPGYSSTIAKIDYLNSMYTKFSSFLPGLQQTILPARSSEKLYVSSYSIDQISDSRVTVNMTNGGTGKMLKFSSNSNSSFDFTFRLTVTSKYGTVSKTIQARLSNPEVIGTWDIDKTYFQDDNTPGSFEPGKGSYIVFGETTLTIYDLVDTTTETYPYSYNKTNKTITFDGSTFKQTVFDESEMVLSETAGSYTFEYYLRRRQ